MRLEHIDDVVDQIRPNDRAAFVGPTDSGKTVLMREIAKHFDNVVMESPKGEWAWDLQIERDPQLQERKQKRYSRRAYDLAGLRTHLNQVEADGSGDPVVVLPRRPNLHGLTPPQVERAMAMYWMQLDEPFRLALERGNTMACSDELYFHCSGSNFQTRAPHLFFHVTQGRSLGNGALFGCQRPFWVPKIVFSEAQHVFVFYLEEQDDRDAMDGRAGKKRGQPSPINWDTLHDEEHSFVWISRRNGVSEPLHLNLEERRLYV